MKPNTYVTPIPVDRLATSEEVRAAVSHLSDQPEQYATGTAWEIAADLGGYVRIPTMESETFRLIEELLEEQDTGIN